MKKLSHSNLILKKTANCSSKLAALLGCLIFSFLGYYSLRYTCSMATEFETLTTVADSLPLQFFSLFLFALFGICLLQISKKLTERTLTICAAVLSFFIFGLCCLLVFSAHNYPYGDLDMVYQAAAAIVTKDYTAIESQGYFSIYPHQMGLAQIYAFLFTVTHTTRPVVIYVFQSFLLSMTILIGYFILKEYQSTLSARLFYLAGCLLFLPMYLYTLYAYGEIIGMFCTITAVYCFLLLQRPEKKKLLSVLCWFGLFFTFSIVCMVRIALIIVWIALFLTQLLFCMQSKKNWAFPFGLLLVLFFALFVKDFSLQRIQKEVSRDLQHEMPSILWVAMGLQDDSPYQMGPGSDNGYAWQTYIGEELDAERASAAAMENIQETLSMRTSLSSHIAFFREKALSQWNEPSYGSFTMTKFQENPAGWIEELYYGKVHDFFYAFLNTYQSVLYIGAVFFFLNQFRHPEKTLKLALGLVLIGAFLFSLIWEIKSRYAFPYMIYLILCVSSCVPNPRQLSFRVLPHNHSKAN